ncbi:MAG: hypothetical protein ACM3SQ_12940 [Betaproteobacteria bacterium]
MEPRRWLIALTLVACGVFVAGRQGIAALDICGCIGSPKSLGAFDTIAGTGLPPGTTSAFRSMTIPLPADGVLVFDSANFAVRPSDSGVLDVFFTRNQANTPVTILASGNVTIGTSVTLHLTGDGGTGGSNGGAGVGGLGGPGGFRGGDGAYQAVNGTTDGGAGLGPTGGASGLASGTTRGGDGTFFGLPELLPLVGGAGGGGGASFSTSLNCAGGGGGGGGGAILIASNGTISISGALLADGGGAGTPSNGGCATTAGAGSGGAIRLVADTIAGTGALYARGGGIPFVASSSGKSGIIRLEAITDTLPPGNTDPPASRTTVPGPIVNPFSPTVVVTTVAGQAVPTPATGNMAGVDVVIPAPGPAEIDLGTSGVPGGTVVEVVVKPRVGSGVLTLNTTLSNCDTAGNCIAAVTPTLAAGAYVIEARATFQTP